MAQQTTDTLASADCSPQGIDGGLNLKADPTRLSPPATTRSDNAHYDGIGNVTQLPGFVSSGLNSAKHVYNLHARDCNQPSTTGDLMVHGEYPDGAAGYTVSTWAHNGGTSPSLNQPTLPFNARTKVLGGRLGGPNVIANLGPLEARNLCFVKQDVVPAGQKRRYAMGYCYTSNVMNAAYVCGNVDGLTESGFYTNTIGIPSQSPGGGFATDMGTLQGTSNFITLTARFVSGQPYNLVISIFDFYGNYLSEQVITGALGQLDDGGPAYQILQHAGKTFIAYYGASDKFLRFYDVLGFGTTFATQIGSGTVTSAFSVFSPYPVTPKSGEYLGVIKNNAAYLLFRFGPTSTWNIVMGPQALPNASSQPSGTARLQATGTLIATDVNGGIGANATFLMTIFRNYPEANAGPNPPFASYYNNSIAVDQISYVAGSNPAAYGTVQNLQTNVFRTPGGLVLSSQAFNSCPGEANFAGSSAARQPLCLVRALPLEPLSATTWSFGQPTYFLINHRAKVAGRFLESGAIGGQLYGTSASTSLTPAANASFLFNALSRPLFLNGDDTTNDLAALTIAIPAWSITNATVTPPVTLQTGAVFATNAPATANYTPTAIVLQQSANATSIPAVQGGPYVVTSGPVTCIHDGLASVEANYHFACPNLVAIARTSGTALATGPATYYYVGILEWYDEQGQLHRSAPSLPTFVTTLTVFYGADVYIPQIPTSKPGSVTFKLYRSIANRLLDRNYYLVGMTTLSSVGYTSVGDGTILDAAAVTSANPNPPNGAINAQPALYTGTSANSGALTYPSQMPPPFIWQTGNKGRAFGLAQIQGQFQLFYTSPTAAQLPPEWCLNNYVPVPFDIGDARSIEAIDDNVVIFGTRYNGRMAGDGPAPSNSVGYPNVADGFGAVVFIPTPAGVLGSGSPTRVPDGIVFQGFSGIQLLNRAITATPIGAPVDALTGRQVGNLGTVFGRGITLPSLQSVVWPNPKGPALVYSYLTQKFSTWPLLTGASSLVQTSDGTIYAALQPVSGTSYLGPASSSSGADLGTLVNNAYAPTFNPNSLAPGLVLETPWILPQGSSGGESRVWNACITGTWQGPHTLQIEQAYDYEAYSLLRTYDMSVAPRQYQVIAQPRANTRMQAVRYRISLLPLTNISSTYLMATLSDLVLFSAKQQGTVRASAANRG